MYLCSGRFRAGLCFSFMYFEVFCCVCERLSVGLIIKVLLCRNRALALVNSSGQGAFSSRGLPAPLTSQTETETELERPISPLTEDSFSM